MFCFCHEISLSQMGTPVLLPRYTLMKSGHYVYSGGSWGGGPGACWIEVWLHLPCSC